MTVTPVLGGFGFFLQNLAKTFFCERRASYHFKVSGTKNVYVLRKII